MYTERQALISMIAMLDLMQRSWFAGQFKGDANRYVPPLLVATYLWSKLNRPLSVGEAFDAMHVKHSKTGNRYIDLAIGLELIVRGDVANADGRKKVLLPTERLEDEMRDEAAGFADCLRDAVGAFVRDPLPETGAADLKLRKQAPVPLSNRYLIVEEALPKLVAAGSTHLASAFAVADARHPRRQARNP